MKRIKMYLVAAALLGAGSAFIPSTTPPGDIYVKVGSEFKLKSSQSGSCQVQNPAVCNYALKAIHGPMPYQLSDFDYNPDEQKIWVAN